ncbi:MAG: type II toxin-antitoxin system VapC family toxin [bacterium]
MILLDVNVLVYAHRQDAQDHARFKGWLEAVLAAGAPFGVPDLVFSGFLRVVTHPKVFNPPSPLEKAWEFVEALRTHPQCITVGPGPGHWRIFRDLCVSAGAKGNLVPDAFLAALALEQGAEWLTTDRDFSRFVGLKWRHPLAAC